MKKNNQTTKLNALSLGGLFFCISLFSGLYTVIAATGKANLALVVADNTLAVGEQTTATLTLNTSALVLNGSEDIGTISIFLDFPADRLEVVGNINFTNSAFPTPYVGTVNNTEGTIEIVRARDQSHPLAQVAEIGSITFRVKNTAPAGNAEISFSPGLNNVLLNDPANTDVVGALTGGMIIVSGSATPTATPDGQATPTPPGASGVTKVWMTLDDPEISQGETTTARIRIDTGKKSISSIDLQYSYPTDFLTVNGNAVDLTNGAFESAVSNVIDPNAGTISIVLFSNPPVVTANGYIGSFSVTRLDPEQSGIFLQKTSGAFLGDINNTNVLSGANSFGAIFPAITGAAIYASLSPDSILASGSATLSFTSSKAGYFRIKKDTCNNFATLADGNVVLAGTENRILIAGSELGIGRDHKLFVCFTDSNGQISSSDQMILTVAPVVATNTTNSSSGSSSPGGGSGSGLRQYPGANMNTVAPTNDSAKCESPVNFHAEALGDGKILFTWDKLSDARITGLELHWGTESGNLASAIELPLIPKMVFPAKGLAAGQKYYFGLATVGMECLMGASEEVSAIKHEDSEMTTQNPPPQHAAADTEINMGGAPSGLGGSNHSISGSQNMTGAGGNASGSKKTAAKQYANMPPHAAGSGPVALSGILALLSALATFYCLRKARSSKF